MLQFDFFIIVTTVTYIDICIIHYQTTSAGITYLHVSMLLCFRGQDVSTFQPTPDIILVADCIYYEEVRMFMFALQRYRHTWALQKHCLS